jgi:hypothetical protein
MWCKVRTKRTFVRRNHWKYIKSKKKNLNYLIIKIFGDCKHIWEATIKKIRYI